MGSSLCCFPPAVLGFGLLIPCPLVLFVRIILYAITGCVSALFCIVIISGVRLFSFPFPLPRVGYDICVLDLATHMPLSHPWFLFPFLNLVGNPGNPPPRTLRAALGG